MASMELMDHVHPMKDDAAAGAPHNGFLFGAHHGDWADNDILGLWSSTGTGQVVSFTIAHE